MRKRLSLLLIPYLIWELAPMLLVSQNAAIPEELRLSKILLKAAPATYLIFLTHALLYFPVKLLAGSECYTHYHYLINPMVALLIICLATLSVSLMRHHCPRLLPYIAGIRK